MSIANLEHEYFPQLNANILNARVLFARDIDANTDFSTTLFLGSNPTTTDIQLGAVGGHPITIIPGVFCTQMNAGGTLGVGPVLIGNQSETTAVVIGNLSSNTNVLGAFSLPSSTLTPLRISDSFAQQSIITGCGGAIISNAIAELAYYKINNIVTLTCKCISAPVTIVNANQPITFTTLLPAAVSPSVTTQIIVGVLDGTANPDFWQAGRCIIGNNGSINIGNISSIVFTAGSIQFTDFSISYPSP